MNSARRFSMKGHLLWGAVVAVIVVSANAVAGISGGAFTSSSNAAPILLGPVEAVKEREAVVVVLGQKLPQRVVGRVELGDTVAVFGSVRADGSLDISSVQR